MQVSDRITKEVQEKTYPLPIEMSPEDFPSTKFTNRSATTQVDSSKVEKRSQTQFFDTILHHDAVSKNVKNADDQSGTTQVDCDKVEKRLQSHFFNTILH